MAKFTRAIVRPPGTNFADGLTSEPASPPNIEMATQQHALYCAVLRRCGLEVISLAPQPDFPDRTFVEDTAIVTGRGAILCRPGASQRTGEVESIAAALGPHYPGLRSVAAPGTLDGGDVCEVDGWFLIGISARTNAAGAEQLRSHLADFGFSAALLDIRSCPGFLHLKSGVAYLGDGIWVADAAIVSALKQVAAPLIRQLIRPESNESYAANCVRINDWVLVAEGYPRLRRDLLRLGLQPLPIQMSEFRKMDGGLSCLSLRF